MADFFALLGLEPRPWLDLEDLKARYHKLTAEQHPDVSTGGGGKDFADVNRAYQVLADPVARLRHLLELQWPAALVRLQAVPGEVASYFDQIGEARHAVEAFLKKYAAATSPLAKALLSAEQYEVQERVETTLGTLAEKQNTLLQRLRETDAAWPASLDQVPALWQSLGYLAKWTAMLRESLLRMAGI